MNNIRLPVGQITQSGADTTGVGSPTWAISGPVVDSHESKYWIGADKHTNNTGELSAMHYAIARALSRPRGSGYECICADSTYTINMTTGKWIPRHGRNTKIIRRLRATWNQLLKQRPNEVRLAHVRSHTIIAGNDMAG